MTINVADTVEDNCKILVTHIVEAEGDEGSGISVIDILFSIYILI